MAKTRRVGMQNERAKLPKAPRPPSQASARPTLEVMHARKRGRDVGFAEPVFALPICGLVGDVEGRNRAASGTRLHLQNCKLFFRLPSKFDRLLAGEFSRI